MAAHRELPGSSSLQPTRLGTAELLPPQTAEVFHAFKPGGFWLGRSPFRDGTLATDGPPLGFKDDRHVLLVGGTRGGKGTGYIVPNLCLWPGSVVCVDPKGENAMLTADARSEGRNGHPQAVYVLDPFNAAQLQDEGLRAAFNPLWELMEHDPDGEDHGTPDNEDFEPAMRPVVDAVDEAAIIASAVVVEGDGKPGQSEFWHGSAKRMIGALILHVISNPRFRGRRNLVTVRRLLMAGDEDLQKLVEAQGKAVPSGQLLMWNDIALAETFDGVLHEDGAFFAELAANDPEQFSGVLGTAAFHTEFLKSPQLRQILKRSSFGLDELKSDPRGISLYLCLPQRFMSSHHYRWLRMMIGLTTQVMEKNPDDPASGHAVLMLLDEFTSLKRMEYIEEAVTQYAGHGLKLFFVVQTLDKLSKVYPGWETFISQSGIKIFFNADDNFTREYVSKLVGETEIVIRQRGTNHTSTTTGGWSEMETVTRTEGGGRADMAGESSQRGTSEQWQNSQGGGENYSSSRTNNTARGFSRQWSSSEQEGFGQHKGITRQTRRGLFNMLFNTTSYDPDWSENSGSSHQRSRSVTEGGGDSDTFSRGESQSRGGSTQWGNSFGGGQQESKTGNTSRTVNSNYSDAKASARGRSGSDAHGEGESEQEQWQRRPIFLPEEIGRFFSGQDEFTRNESWPGLALVLVGGARTMVVRRVLYFEDPLFAGLYNHHRKHMPEVAPVLALPAPGRDFEWGSKPGAVTHGPMMKAEDIVGFWKGIGLILGALVVAVVVIALLVKGVMMLFSH